MKKGFVGPIGDDIPSIFPIVIGVILFISTMGFVGMQFDARNVQLNQKKAGLEVSYAILRSGFISDNEFETKCPTAYKPVADRLAKNYWINLKKFCYYVNVTSDIFSAKTEITQSEENSFGSLDSSDIDITGPSPCYSNSIADQVAGNEFVEDKRPESYDLLQFPVAVECNKDGTIKGPGMLYIVIWK